MGTPRDAARSVAESIAENCLYGHDSHGMALLPRFIKDVETGKIKPKAVTETVKRSVSAARIDGHRGFGQLTTRDAMSTAIEIAKETGVSAVTADNCN